jgi:hypothetical protein
MKIGIKEFRTVVQQLVSIGNPMQTMNISLLTGIVGNTELNHTNHRSNPNV